MKENIQNMEKNIGSYVEEPWDIINSYFDGKHLKQLVRHQVESYNNFVTYQILVKPNELIMNKIY